MVTTGQVPSGILTGAQMDDRAIGRRVWTTNDVAERDQFGYFCDAVCEAFMELTPRRSSSGAFSAIVDSAQHAGGRVNKVEGSPHSVQRSKRQVNRQTDPCFYLNIQLRSRCAILQGDRQVTLDRGQLALFDGARPFEIHHPDDTDMAVASLQLPREDVEKAARHYRIDFKKLGAVRVSDHPFLGPLIASTTRTIADRKALLSAFDTHALVDSLVGLSVAACAKNREASEAENPDMHPPLLLAIIDFVDMQLERNDISARTVASHFGISPRYVHKLFEHIGPSFSQFVRERRLDRAMNHLRDPQNAHASISDIAFGSGFSDLSNFNKRFKQRFGITPREARRK